MRRSLSLAWPWATCWGGTKVRFAGMVEASISPMRYFSIISLADSLCPISSKSLVASFPGYIGDKVDQVWILKWHGGRIKTQFIVPSPIMKEKMTYRLLLVVPHLHQDAHPWKEWHHTPEMLNIIRRYSQAHFASYTGISKGNCPPIPVG